MGMSSLLVNVANLYHVCSLKMRNLREPGTCASDCCGQLASTAVKDHTGNLYWRCGAHRAIISAVWGEVVTEYEVPDTSEYATAYERLAAIRDAANEDRLGKFGPDQGSSVPWTQVVCSHDEELH